MSDDLFKTAFTTVLEVKALAETFPARSPGRAILRQAARRLRLCYIATDVEKKRLIIEAIEQYNTRATEITHFIRLSRREVEVLLLEMVEDGQLIRTREQPTGGARGGRPFFRFNISNEFLKSRK